MVVDFNTVANFVEGKAVMVIYQLKVSEWTPPLETEGKQVDKNSENLVFIRADLKVNSLCTCFHCLGTLYIQEFHHITLLWHDITTSP